MSIEQMTQRAFQDYYPKELSHCFGCGSNNEAGHQVKSYWQACENSDANAEQTVSYFTPKQEHTALPGYVYGGLLASLIDCHGTGSAAAMAYKQAGREMASLPALRFVTAALNISYLAPTPLGYPLTLVGKFKEIKPKKIIVEVSVLVEGKMCVQGEVIAVLMPDSMLS